MVLNTYDKLLLVFHKDGFYLLMLSWHEHPSYCRTTVGIRPLRSLSAVGLCETHLTTSSHHLTSLFAQHWAYSTSNTLMWSFDVRWLGTALSPTSNILQFCRIWVFIYIIIFSGKFHVKSKLQRCLYMNFYQSYEDLFTGCTQYRHWVRGWVAHAGQTSDVLNGCHIAQIAPLSFQGSHRTQTQTSEVRWLHASVVTEWSPCPLSLDVGCVLLIQRINVICSCHCNEG